MASSGIRLGAWNYFKWGHVIPVEKEGKVVASKLRVYADEEDEYYTFISLEAYNELLAWMKHREESGEMINNESWLMRNLSDVTTPTGKGIVTIPKQLKAEGIKRLMERALWAQGIRKNLSKDRRRHEFQANHSYRKWFKTRCELAGLRSIVVEILLSHCTGISDSYFRPTEAELLEEFLKAADYLTINEENRLRRKIEMLAVEKSKVDFALSQIEEMKKRIGLD